MKKEAIMRVIESHAKGEKGCDTSVLMNAIANSDRLNDKDVDIVIVEGTQGLLTFHAMAGGGVNVSWRFSFPKIARGEYPLEKLPKHVRDRAKELYYKP